MCKITQLQICQFTHVPGSHVKILVLTVTTQTSDCSFCYDKRTPIARR
jgi:hypothetical protein